MGSPPPRSPGNAGSRKTRRILGDTAEPGPPPPHLTPSLPTWEQAIKNHLWKVGGRRRGAGRGQALRAGGSRPGPPGGAFVFPLSSVTSPVIIQWGRETEQARYRSPEKLLHSSSVHKAIKSSPSQTWRLAETAPIGVFIMRGASRHRAFPPVAPASPTPHAKWPLLQL